MNYRALYFTPNYGTFITISPTRISVLSNFTAECFFKDNGTSCQYINILQKRRPDVRYEEYVDNEDGTVTTNTTYANGMSLWFMSVGASSLRIRADSVPESGVKPNNGCNWNQGADCTTSIKDGKWHHLAVTYDYETLSLKGYVDYKHEATVTTAYPLPVITSEIIIGPNNFNSAKWGDYIIDEVRISEGILPISRFMRLRSSLGTRLLFK